MNCNFSFSKNKEFIVTLYLPLLVHWSLFQHGGLGGNIKTCLRKPRQTRFQGERKGQAKADESGFLHFHIFRLLYFIYLHIYCWPCQLPGRFLWVTAQIYPLVLLNPTSHVMHQQLNIQQLYALPTLYLCVLYLSENKQRLVPLTA